MTSQDHVLTLHRTISRGSTFIRPTRLHIFASNFQKLLHSTTDRNNSVGPDILSPSTEQEKMTTFHLFPQLPPEIRIKIWRYCDSTTNHLSSFKPQIKRRRFSAILHSCHETRTEFLASSKKHNTDKQDMATANRKYRFCKPFKNQRGLFVDFESDTIAIELLPSGELP